MERSLEQRYAIKFCFHLGKTASETFALVKEAYKDDALSRAQVFRWFNEFKNRQCSSSFLTSVGLFTKNLYLRDKPSPPFSTKKSLRACTELSDENDRRLPTAGSSTTTTLNAPAHAAFLVTAYLARIGVATLPQPPYSPDMSPPDFFLFPKLKRSLKGHRFEDVPAIQRAVTESLKEVTAADFQRAFAAWESRWQRCIDAQGDYFEEF